MCMSAGGSNVTPPSPAANPPTMADPNISASGAAARNKAAAAAGAGFSNTLQTGGQGLLSTPTLAQRSLLGQ